MRIELSAFILHLVFILFSLLQDPGTGIQVRLLASLVRQKLVRLSFVIQPFLTPVPPVGSELLSNTTLPFRYIIGAVRTAIVLLLLPVYVALVPGLCLILVRLLPASVYFSSSDVNSLQYLRYIVLSLISSQL